jgi:hypothetical protein
MEGAEVYRKSFVVSQKLRQVRQNETRARDVTRNNLITFDNKS